MSEVLIIIFTRYPEPGNVKTRLIPSIGAQAAAKWHEKMTEYTLKQALRTGYPVQIHYTGGDACKMQAWLGHEHSYVAQTEGDLGQRMHDAFAGAFASNVSGKKKVLLLGSDCPDNRRDNLQKAIALLENSHCVLGPSTDGGYYMLGLTHMQSALFEDIAWGSHIVLEQTLAKAKNYALLPALSDVDHAADIPAKISVIIPTYNEEERIATAVESAAQGFNVEIIVADAASTDNTSVRTEQAGGRFHPCPVHEQGRARQMNGAAHIAHGEIIMFIHADCILPTDFDLHVRKAMQDPRTILGYFSFALEESFFGKSLLVWGTNVRAKTFQRPYGDQGFFLRKETFDELNGFAPVPILEDVFFIKAVKKLAKQRNQILRCLPYPLLTSARRWIKHGFLKTTTFNQLILLAAKCGMDLQKLQRIYKSGSFFKKLCKSKSRGLK